MEVLTKKERRHAESLLRRTTAAQEKFWTLLRELEIALGDIEVEGSTYLASYGVDDLLEGKGASDEDDC